MNRPKTGQVVTYCGEATDWQPGIAIERTDLNVPRGTRIFEAQEDSDHPRIFETIREAVHWARDNGYVWITMTDGYLRG